MSSLKVALFVGTILALINHSGAIVHATLTKVNMMQIVLTYLVPYGVSTYASVKTILIRSGTDT